MLNAPQNKSMRRLVITVMICGFLFIGLLVANSPKQKLYDGKTVRQWVAELNPQSGMDEQREAASSALVRIGDDALPEIERILAWRSRAWIEKAKGLAMRCRLMKPPLFRPQELQSRACEAARRLAEFKNSDINRLVPHLEYHFTNGTYADWSSGEALARAGTAGINVLTNQLFTGKMNVRDMAGSSLRQVRTNTVAVAALIQSAKTETNAQLRANTLLYLTQSAGAPEQLVPLGLGFLQSGDGYERWAAARLLEPFATLPEVRAAFELALEDSDARVQRVARAALNPSRR